MSPRWEKRLGNTYPFRRRSLASNVKKDISVPERQHDSKNSPRHSFYQESRVTANSAWDTIMVGVPGKSRGCNTCRKRKIKCDGEKEPCGQCRKSNRHCAGYSRDRHFKNLSALDHSTLLARAQPLAPLTEPSFIMYDDSCSHEPEMTTVDEKKIFGSDSTNPSELFFYFMEHYIPKETLPAKSEPVSWLQGIPDMQGSSAPLDQAMSALSMVRLGRKCGDDKLRREGMSNYGRALEGLQALLSNHGALYDEYTLASCMTMSIFEILEASDENAYAWTSHVEGISKLFQVRGPELHVNESSHRLFLGFRPTGIIHDLAIRKPSYLGEQRWLTIPWINIPKSDFHQLLDIMARMPDIIEQTETCLRAYDSETLMLKRAPLLTQSWAFHSQLQEWYRQLLKKSLEPLYSERTSLAISKSSGGSLESLFSTSLNFRSFEMARIHLFYWAALLLIYNNIRDISHSASQAQQLPTGDYRFDSLLFHQQTISSSLMSEEIILRRTREVATLIAKSMEYLLSEEMHILGPQNVFFPLRIAMHSFSHSVGPAVEWCRSVFEELDRRGYPFGKILSAVEWDDIPGFLSQRGIIPV